MKRSIILSAATFVAIAFLLGSVVLPVPRASAQQNVNHQSTNQTTPFMLVVDQVYYDDNYVFSQYQANYYSIPLIADKLYVLYYYSGLSDWLNATLRGPNLFYILEQDPIHDMECCYLIWPEVTGYYNFTLRYGSGSGSSSCLLAFLEVPTIEFELSANSVTIDPTTYWDFDINGYSVAKVHFQDAEVNYKRGLASGGWDIHIFESFSFTNRHQLLNASACPTLNSTEVDLYNNAIFFSTSQNMIQIDKVSSPPPTTPVIPGFHVAIVIGGAIAGASAIVCRRVFPCKKKY